MNFADNILTEDLSSLRHQLLYHPLWQAIENGSLERDRLKTFALQDWWLVRDAYRLDALAIASVNDLATQELLIAKLIPKLGGYKLLLRFGNALGLNQADFDNVEPLAGCMALTNFFYWMLNYGTIGEKLAAISASEDIFVQICARIAPALSTHYNLTTHQIEFFTAHDQLGQVIKPLDNDLFNRYTTPTDRHLITRAVRLSHQYELMFYDTIMTCTM